MSSIPQFSPQTSSKPQRGSSPEHLLIAALTYGLVAQKSTAVETESKDSLAAVGVSGGDPGGTRTLNQLIKSQLLINGSAKCALAAEKLRCHFRVSRIGGNL